VFSEADPHGRNFGFHIYTYIYTYPGSVVGVPQGNLVVGLPHLLSPNVQVARLLIIVP
jgi:hypothetical protein